MNTSPSKFKEEEKKTPLGGINLQYVESSRKRKRSGDCDPSGLKNSKKRKLNEGGVHATSSGGAAPTQVVKVTEQEVSHRR